MDCDTLDQPEGMNRIMTSPNVTTRISVSFVILMKWRHRADRITGYRCPRDS